MTPDHDDGRRLRKIFADNPVVDGPSFAFSSSLAVRTGLAAGRTLARIPNARSDLRGVPACLRHAIVGGPAGGAPSRDTATIGAMRETGEAGGEAFTARTTSRAIGADVCQRHGGFDWCVLDVRRLVHRLERLRRGRLQAELTVTAPKKHSFNSFQLSTYSSQYGKKSALRLTSNG